MIAVSSPFSQLDLVGFPGKLIGLSVMNSDQLYCFVDSNEVIKLIS